MQRIRCVTTSTKRDRRFCKEPFNGYRLAELNIGVHVDGLGVVTMTISFETVAIKYLSSKKLSGGTRKEYKSTVTKWLAWGKGVNVDQMERSHIRDFLDWVTKKPPTTEARMPDGPRTRLVRIFGRSCPGLGSKTIWRSSHGFPNPSRNEMWLADTT